MMASEQETLPQWAEYRCARPIISRSSHPACTARPVHTKYMVKRSWPPSQGWCTFLRNHAPDVAAMDLFATPTIGFDVLYTFIIVRLARRDLVWINVTPHPTADWITGAWLRRKMDQPWDGGPHRLTMYFATLD